MRIFIFIVLLVISSHLSAQSTYNKWSFDGNLGFVSALGPYASGYSSNWLMFAHLDGGARHMFTDKVGVKWDFGFDRIKNDEMGPIKGDNPVDKIPSLEFESHYFRTNLQLILNLGRMMEIENLHPRLGCLMHFGFGFASLKSKSNSVWFSSWRSQGTDEMMNVMLGLQPQYMINSKLAFHADFSIVANGWQSKTWDFTENSFKKGLHGKLLNFSVGMSYYFGKADKHLDWVFVEGGVMRKDSMKVIETIRTVQSLRVEDDEDDVEEVKREEATSGDYDNDGIPDDEDACPTEKGDLPNGCPSSDRDADGVRNDIDDCPDLAGSKDNGGCPSIHIGTKIIMNQAQIGVKFVKNRPEMIEGVEDKLDQVVLVMKEHPEYYLELKGHTDNLGEKEPLISLSLARAETVKAYLVANGVEEERLSTVGLGDTVPLAPNDNPQGRELNRRVEFKIRFSLK